MFYTEDLENIVFNRHNNQEVDEIIIISGYLGPYPVSHLNTLPFHSTVIYGMYGSEGIKTKLHNSLIEIQNSNASTLKLLYSKIPVHSKCYIWKNNNNIVDALIGSANFSTNGLTTPYREVLTEIKIEAFPLLNDYINLILNKSISCHEGSIISSILPTICPPQDCLLSLLQGNGDIHKAGGLNWGQNPTNHTNLNDAYIPIRIQDIKNFPELFPTKLERSTITGQGGRINRHNDAVDVVWDDGVNMRVLLEGSQEIEGKKYPKQISSFPNKSELGLYFRNRLGVAPGQPVTKQDLINYGRDNVQISLIGNEVYSFDFSNNVS